MKQNEPTIQVVMRHLSDWLGPGLMGEMCGLPGAAPLKRWQVQAPGAEEEAKLRMGHKVFRLIRSAEGADIARAWMIGMNPHLENHDEGDHPDGCPVTEIGLGYGEDVLTAACTYLQDPSLT